MRNVVVQALPPNATITLTVDPPIAEHERPYVLTIKGQQSVAVQLIDTAHVSITNSTSELAPFMFFVGRQLALPPQLAALLTKGS